MDDIPAKPVTSPPGGRPEAFRGDELLARLGGDRELARAVLAAFLSDVPDRVRDLAAALPDGDAESIMRQAHTIKGAAINFSAPMMAELAEKIEHCARDGQMEEARRQGPDLERAMDDVLRAVEGQGWQRLAA